MRLPEATSILFALMPGVVLSQTLIWPTDASRLLTSTFGEYRPGRIHAGIDIKTWGREGYRVYAVDSGYLWRLRISPYGYGKAIYLKLDDGRIVVYAHLKRFAGEIQRIARREQRRKGRFSIDKYFPPDQIRVEKGQLIAYTGSSGAGPPHLHFEIRDEWNRPLNPLSQGLFIKDTLPPVITRVSFSPLSYGSWINGDIIPQILDVSKRSRSLYVLKDTVRVWGEVGVGISCYDRADGSDNCFSVYKTELWLDGGLIFRRSYDRFRYSQTRLVELDRDYRLMRWGEGLFYKLYRDPENDLPFYGSFPPGAGILKGSSLGHGVHTFTIRVYDFYDNCSQLKGTILIEEPLSTPGGRVYVDGGDNGDLKLALEKTFLDDFVRVRLTFNRPLVRFPYVVLSARNQRVIEMHPKGPGEFIGAFPLNVETDGLVRLEVYAQDVAGNREVFCDEFRLRRIPPEEGGEVSSSDGRCFVYFPRNSVYRPLFGRIEKIHTEGEGYDFRSSIYAVEPHDVPLRRKIRVRIVYPVDEPQPDKLGLYFLNTSGRWVFLGNELDVGKGSIGGRALSLEKFALIRDIEPPLIFCLFPRDSSHIRLRKPTIKIAIKDELSGIGGEEDIILKLDGQKLIAEYDPEKGVVFHEVEVPLSLGQHRIWAWAKDRSNNITQKTFIFWVVK